MLRKGKQILFHVINLLYSTYTLVAVPATTKCSSTENCKHNSSGEYECIRWTPLEKMEVNSYATEEWADPVPL
jgi:hypothetical protein